ncbi:hypothetical protein BGX38DRAFT_1142980 [Terfezia claveryi]|nr:hypothetical protein BGX38DRAFT_1142980 [Terfezia claveryi]
MKISNGSWTVLQRTVEISLSTVSVTKYQSVLAYLELEDAEVIEFNVTPTHKVLNDDGFVWGPEKEDAQMDRCLNWLKQIISLPAKLEMHSIAGRRDFLNYSFGGTKSYALKGTAGIVIVQDIYAKALHMRAGIQMTIELKKELHEADRRQAVMQLIAASSFSQFPVTSVLTDLRQNWQFM